jgi:hypothetical protein
MITEMARYDAPPACGRRPSTWWIWLSVIALPLASLVAFKIWDNATAGGCTYTPKRLELGLALLLFFGPAPLLVTAFGITTRQRPATVARQALLSLAAAGLLVLVTLAFDAANLGACGG